MRHRGDLKLLTSLAESNASDILPLKLNGQVVEHFNHLSAPVVGIVRPTKLDELVNRILAEDHPLLQLLEEHDQRGFLLRLALIKGLRLSRRDCQLDGLCQVFALHIVRKKLSYFQMNLLVPLCCRVQKLVSYPCNFIKRPVSGYCGEDVHITLNTNIQCCQYNTRVFFFQVFFVFLHSGVSRLPTGRSFSTWINSFKSLVLKQSRPNSHPRPCWQ